METPSRVPEAGWLFLFNLPFNLLTMISLNLIRKLELGEVPLKVGCLVITSFKVSCFFLPPHTQSGIELLSAEERKVPDASCQLPTGDNRMQRPNFCKVPPVPPVPLVSTNRRRRATRSGGGFAMGIWGN